MSLLLVGRAIAQSDGPKGSETAPSNRAIALDTVYYSPAVPSTIEPWSPLKTEKLRGEVKELNAKNLVIVIDGVKRELPSDRVEYIEPAWDTPEAAEAFERYHRREYVAALKQNVRVINTDSALATWQRRVLLAELIESAESIGQIRIAGTLFLEMCKADPPVFLAAGMPLNWTTREADRATLETARGWLADESEAAGLLGASWLLLGSDKSEEAKTRLRTLSSSKVDWIRQAAAVQLWRLTPPPETLSNLDRWYGARDKMLPSMQLGPTEFIADRMSRIGQSTSAVEEWMRVALIHEHRISRSDAAMESAKKELARSSATDQVDKLTAWIEDRKRRIENAK
ncbi:MAG: hypothetical protein U0892_14895 [Pirellulales bacterium]